MKQSNQPKKMMKTLEQQKRTLIQIDPEILKQAKIQALQEGISFKKLINACLAEYLIKNKKRS